MKLRCAWYRRQMEPYADAEEQPLEGSLLARHLQACDGCRTAWIGMRRLRAALREALAVPAAPDGFEERAWARLAIARPRPSTVRAPALALGVAVLAAVLALIALRERPVEHGPRLVANLHWPMAATRPSGARVPSEPNHSLAAREMPDGQRARGASRQFRAAVPGAEPPVYTVRTPLKRADWPGMPGLRRPGPDHGEPAHYLSPVRPADGGEPKAHPALPAASARPIPDLKFLDGSDPALLAQWSRMNRREEEKLETIRRHLPPPADDFVRIPFPLIAATGSAGIAAATREYAQQAKVVDTRLFRKVTLAEKGVSLADFCAHLQEQTGVALSASRAVMDEKVTIFVNDERARDVMRAVARLFGFLWSRSGREGAYRYELDQDLRSQLIEEELRNKDQDAALLALDAQMQKYRPFLDKSFDELKKQWDQLGEAEKRDVWTKPDPRGLRQLWHLVPGGGWAGVQLYFRLSQPERGALLASQGLTFRSDAPDPDHRLPAELIRPFLQSFNQYRRGNTIGIAEVPGLKRVEVHLWLNRSELGQLSLVTTASADCDQAVTGVLGFSQPNRELATSQSPAREEPDNAIANAALRGRAPFDRVVSLHPKACRPAVKGFRITDANLNMDMASTDLDLSQPYALSADVWEAVHQATGRPIVADYYTHLYPLPTVTVDHEPLFDALCAEGDLLGVRWRKGGDFLLCRSTSYFWDKLKEIPNRYLRRWARDRDANGGLPLTDFLEMAGMTDQQLDSDPVAQGIEHYWGLPEWAWLGRHRSSSLRQNARMLALLTPDQLRRALEPDGIPLQALRPAQQQRVMQLRFEQQAAEERETGSSPSLSPEQFAHAWLRALYVPDGWYVAYQTTPFSPSYVYGGRTPEEARTAQRQFWHTTEPLEVRRARDGYFSSDFYFVVGK